MLCFALLHIRKLKPKGINRLPVVTQHVSDRAEIQKPGSLSAEVRRGVHHGGQGMRPAPDTPHRHPVWSPSSPGAQQLLAHHHSLKEWPELVTSSGHLRFFYCVGGGGKALTPVVSIGEPKATPLQRYSDQSEWACPI